MPPKALSRFAERGEIGGHRHRRARWSIHSGQRGHTHTSCGHVAVIAARRGTVCGEVGRVLRFPQLRVRSLYADSAPLLHTARRKALGPHPAPTSHSAFRTGDPHWRSARQRRKDHEEEQGVGAPNTSPIASARRKAKSLPSALAPQAIRRTPTPSTRPPEPLIARAPLCQRLSAPSQRGKKKERIDS